MADKKKAPDKKNLAESAGWSSESIREAVKASEEQFEKQEVEPKVRTKSKSESLTKEMLIEFLKENLKIEVQNAAGGFTDPNGRNIVLKLGDEKISSTYINVRQAREYEG